MNEVIREMFLTDWVKEATTNEIVEKLIEHDERGKEIERLNNIINELQKWLEEQIKISQAHDNKLGVNVCNTFKNKLNELKGDSSNE